MSGNELLASALNQVPALDNSNAGKKLAEQLRDHCLVIDTRSVRNVSIIPVRVCTEGKEEGRVHENSRRSCTCLDDVCLSSLLARRKQNE